MSQTHVVHIVRRYGPVGGMERYVWELTRGLARNGVIVTIICEEVRGAVLPEITVILVSPSSHRSRWKAMSLFRSRVSAVIQDQGLGSAIIHSHEAPRVIASRRSMVHR